MQLKREKDTRQELKLSPVEAESDAVNDHEWRANVKYMPHISSLQVRVVIFIMKEFCVAQMSSS